MLGTTLKLEAQLGEALEEEFDFISPESLLSFSPESEDSSLNSIESREGNENQTFYSPADETMIALNTGLELQDVIRKLKELLKLEIPISSSTSRISNITATTSNSSSDPWFDFTGVPSNSMIDLLVDSPGNILELKLFSDNILLFNTEAFEALRISLEDAVQFCNKDFFNEFDSEHQAILGAQAVQVFGLHFLARIIKFIYTLVPAADYNRLFHQWILSNQMSLSVDHICFCEFFLTYGLMLGNTINVMEDLLDAFESELGHKLENKKTLSKELLIARIYFHMRKIIDKKKESSSENSIILKESLSFIRFTMTCYFKNLFNYLSFDARTYSLSSLIRSTQLFNHEFEIDLIENWFKNYYYPVSDEEFYNLFFGYQVDENDELHDQINQDEKGKQLDYLD